MNDQFEKVRELEKAIEEKYGDQSVEHLSRDLTQEEIKSLYSKNHEDSYDRESDDIVISKTRKALFKDKLKCSKCNKMSFSERDDIYLLKSKNAIIVMLKRKK
jgi:hypothetical protein